VNIGPEGEQRALLMKERWRLDGPAPLSLVRKHRPDGPSRPPVLLVHGFAQNRYSWHTGHRSVSAWLAEAGFDVWNLELRGHGNSRNEGQLGAERFDDYAEDVDRALSALPASAFAVGHSLGGAAVYAAAGRRAARGAPLRGAVGIAAIYGFGRGNAWIRGLAKLTHQLEGSRWAGALQVRSRLFGKALGQLTGVTDLLGYGAPLSGWWPGSVEPELLAERLEGGFDWTSLRVWQEMSRWASTGRFDGENEDYDALWHASTTPCLVMLGDRDALLPAEDGRLAFTRSGAVDRTVLLFDDWTTGTHWGHLDIVLGRAAPTHVWPALRDWMAAR
jgi:pimeloyl-ACP methyl ester carboxylesterase